MIAFILECPIRFYMLCSFRFSELYFTRIVTDVTLFCPRSLTRIFRLCVNVVYRSRLRPEIQSFCTLLVERLAHAFTRGPRDVFVVFRSQRCACRVYTLSVRSSGMRSSRQEAFLFTRLQGILLIGGFTGFGQPTMPGA
jgi:hypothetical protein